jgi:acetylglutamate kinase
MLGLSVVVVHGGGPRIEKELNKEKIETKFLNGLRVTDKKVIKIVENVLVDLNNDIVNSLNKRGSKAVSINSKINNIIQVVPDRKELGFVGVPDKINIDIIKDIINKNQIPVVAPLGIDASNLTYNINGDTAASAIAKKLKSRRLLLMTNVEGVYDDKKNLISEIKPFDIENLIKLNIVQGGMIPKIKNCIDAVENGVRGVVILDGRKPHSILNEIFSDEGAGTLIRK